jgi:hypothetical protein
MTTVVELMKLFCINLFTLFCKLDLFINIRNICCITMKKRFNFQEMVSKFMSKKFYEIDPKSKSHKSFFA